MPADVLQQVLPPPLSASYLDGFSQLEGYVVRAADVASARTAYEVVEAFGYGQVADAYSPNGASVDVLRFPAAPLMRIDTAYGTTDPAAATAEAPIVDRPPFRGSGFTASERLIVAQWRVGRTRLAPGTELYRIDRDGGEQFLAVYRDVATGWSGPGVTPDAANALPSHLVGTRARWNGAVYLADLLADGTVALAFLGDTPPAGFERTGAHLWRHVVPRREVAALDAIVTTCRWRGHPFEVTGQFGEQCRLTYTGRNSLTADALGLQFLQPGVYEATAPRNQLTDVAGIQLELPAEPSGTSQPAGAAPHPSPADAAPVPAALPDISVPAEWAGFTEGLRTTLRDLDERTFLIIRWTKGNIFVQYAQDADALTAEAVADEYAPEDRVLTIAQVGEMTDLGWTPPTVNPAGRFNWYLDVPCPATSAVYRHVAAASVQALRIRGVASPDELVYKAWREPQRPPQGVTFYDEDLDPGDPELQLPGLPITRQSSA